MLQMIFVNIPVSDLARSMRFYEALGFTNNPQFTDETAAMYVISDAVHQMLLTHDRFQGFAPLPRADTTKTTSVLIALSRPDRAGVDAITEAALAAGAREPCPAADYGFMYQRTFMDPDGNVFEMAWMDLEAATKAMAK